MPRLNHRHRRPRGDWGWRAGVYGMSLDRAIVLFALNGVAVRCTNAHTPPHRPIEGADPYTVEDGER